MNETKARPGCQAEFDPAFVREISTDVYLDRLGAKDAAAMLERDGEAKVRDRAACYDAMTRSYLRFLRGRTW